MDENPYKAPGENNATPTHSVRAVRKLSVKRLLLLIPGSLAGAVIGFVTGCVLWVVPAMIIGAPPWNDSDGTSNAKMKATEAAQAWSILGCTAAGVVLGACITNALSCRFNRDA